MKEMLREKNILWDELPLHIKHGVYAKKVLKESEAFNPKEQCSVKCLRTEIVNKVFKIAKEDLFFREILTN